MRAPSPGILAIAVLLAAGACHSASQGSPEPTPLPSSGSSLSPSPTPLPSPTASAGPATATCVNGWTFPGPGTALRREPLDIIRGQMGLTGLFVVVDMRYFEGPELPNILEPRPPVVKRWYVKAYLQAQPSFQGRWIVEKRTSIIKGISGVAPFDTTGLHSPDWRAFEGEGPATTYAGLPGQWFGINYDFVTGEGDSGFPGLPKENIGCLDGT